jgi:hypothetical protein
VLRREVQSENFTSNVMCVERCGVHMMLQGAVCVGEGSLPTRSCISQYTQDNTPLKVCMCHCWWTQARLSCQCLPTQTKLRMWPCAVLCCAVLCCAVLCCAVLCCAVLCCAVLCCAVLCCAVLCPAGADSPDGQLALQAGSSTPGGCTPGH